MVFKKQRCNSYCESVILHFFYVTDTMKKSPINFAGKKDTSEGDVLLAAKMDD